jgi:hypothetical protein
MRAMAGAVLRAPRAAGGVPAQLRREPAHAGGAGGGGCVGMPWPCSSSRGSVLGPEPWHASWGRGGVAPPLPRPHSVPGSTAPAARLLAVAAPVVMVRHSARCVRTAPLPCTPPLSVLCAWESERVVAGRGGGGLHPASVQLIWKAVSPFGGLRAHGLRKPSGPPEDLLVAAAAAAAAAAAGTWVRGSSHVHVPGGA